MPSGHFVRTEEHKKNIAASRKGRKRTPEECAAISAGKLAANRKMTEEQKEFRRKWNAENKPRVGMKASEETRQKLRDAKKGRVPNTLLKHGITDEIYAAQKAAGNKWCFVRKHFAPLATFSLGTNCCAECKSNHHRMTLMARFGMTQEEFEAKFAEQGNACEICGVFETDGDRKHIHIDHRHDTGQIRGILCARCNHAMGRLDAIADWALKAAAYDMKYKVIQSAGNARFMRKNRQGV